MPDRRLGQGIKTVIRDLEQSAREVLAVLQAVHQSSSPEESLFSIKTFNSSSGTETNRSAIFSNVCQHYTDEGLGN
ncbi:hypothetical protein ACROYT_G025122 [Oculina patagonica]